MKILWIDVETTGLNAKVNDIITLSAMVEIDGEIKRGINLKIQPHSWDNIDDEALKINGITRKEMKSFDSPEIAHDKLVTFFSKFVDRFDKTDKFQPAGYNVVFDMLFLAEFFIKCGDKYFGSWVDYHKFDIASVVQFFHLAGYFKDMPNFKLVTIAEELGIELKAHDAKEDIIATRDVCYKLIEKLKENKNE